VNLTDTAYLRAEVYPYGLKAQALEPGLKNITEFSPRVLWSADAVLGQKRLLDGTVHLLGGRPLVGRPDRAHQRHRLRQHDHVSGVGGPLLLERAVMARAIDTATLPDDTVREALEFISGALRPADLAEVQATIGADQDPFWALFESWEASAASWLIVDDTGLPIGIFGVSPISSPSSASRGSSGPRGSSATP
jgi:hypothetical protein